MIFSRFLIGIDGYVKFRIFCHFSQIVHLAAYDVDEQFDQYVIPVMVNHFE